MRNLVSTMLGLAVLALVACSQQATNTPVATTASPSETKQVPAISVTNVTREAPPTVELSPTVILVWTKVGDTLRMQMNLTGGAPVPGTCRVQIDLVNEIRHEMFGEGSCGNYRDGWLEFKPAEYTEGEPREATEFILQINQGGGWENAFEIDITDEIFKRR